MKKLPCGCVPDASGFGYCGECTRNLREKIWKNMDEKRKNYDRHFDPEGSRVLDIATNDCGKDDGCSCHINPPCQYCIAKSEDEKEEE